VQRTSIADGGRIEKPPAGNRSSLFIQKMKNLFCCSKKFLPPEPKLSDMSLIVLPSPTHIFVNVP
jgi:hypothetical protein